MPLKELQIAVDLQTSGFYIFHVGFLLAKRRFHGEVQARTLRFQFVTFYIGKHCNRRVHEVTQSLRTLCF